MLKIILLILICDMISGVGHWFEDAYGNPTWKMVGKSIIEPNLEHHKTPNSFLKRTYWSRNNTAIYLTASVFFASIAIVDFQWEVLFCMLYLSQVNEIHAYSHRRKKDQSWILKLIEEIGLVQSNRHHGWHHAAPFDCNYCILTMWLNPILNKINFWNFLERMIYKIAGVNPLRGDEIRGGI